MAKKRMNKVDPEIEVDDEFLLKRNGVDKEFLQFKIHVVPIELESDKKFYQRERIFSQNPWLKFRLLFGSNLRADVLATTAYSAAKYVNSSTSAVYRNWQDLKEAKWDSLSHYHK